MLRVLVPLAVGLILLVAAPTAAAKDRGPEIRVTGVCGGRATAELRLRSREGRIEMRFEVEHSRTDVAWRVVVVHERRVAWKGTVRTTRPGGSFELRRTLNDLSGADAVVVRALGPQGLVCRAGATLPDA